MERLDLKEPALKKCSKRACINNVDEAMFEYYQTFPKQAKPLLSEVQLSDF